MEIIEFKQYILEFANNGYKLDNNDWHPKDWKLWEALYNLVEADGYIEYPCKCIGLFDPQLTPKGELFLQSGGYVGERRSEITATILGFGKDIFKEVFSLFIANGIENIIKIK